MSNRSSSFCPAFDCDLLWLGVRTGELLSQFEERLAGARDQAVRACVQQPRLRQLRFMHELPGTMALELCPQTVYERVREATTNCGPLLVHTCKRVRLCYARQHRAQNSHDAPARAQIGADQKTQKACAARARELRAPAGPAPASAVSQALRALEKTLLADFRRPV